jgi:hypothetical protein
MTVQYVFNPDRALELGIITILVPPDSSSSAAAGNDVSDALYQKFLSYLPRGETDIGQRHVAQFIKESLDGVTMSAISSHFGITPNSASGIINGGLQANIKKAGFATVDPILKIEKRGRQWHYSPGEVLCRQPPIPL